MSGYVSESSAVPAGNVSDKIISVEERTPNWRLGMPGCLDRKMASSKRTEQDLLEREAEHRDDTCNAPRSGGPLEHGA